LLRRDRFFFFFFSPVFGSCNFGVNFATSSLCLPAHRPLPTSKWHPVPREDLHSPFGSATPSPFVSRSSPNRLQCHQLGSAAITLGAGKKDDERVLSGANISCCFVHPFLEPMPASPTDGWWNTVSVNKLCQVSPLTAVKGGRTRPPTCLILSPSLNLAAPSCPPKCPSSGWIWQHAPQWSRAVWRLPICQIRTSNQGEHMLRSLHPIGCRGRAGDRCIQGQFLSFACLLHACWKF